MGRSGFCMGSIGRSPSCKVVAPEDNCCKGVAAEVYRRQECQNFRNEFCVAEVTSVRDRKQEKDEKEKLLNLGGMMLRVSYFTSSLQKWAENASASCRKTPSMGLCHMWLDEPQGSEKETKRNVKRQRSQRSHVGQVGQVPNFLVHIMSSEISTLQALRKSQEEVARFLEQKQKLLSSAQHVPAVVRNAEIATDFELWNWLDWLVISTENLGKRYKRHLPTLVYYTVSSSASSKEYPSSCRLPEVSRRIQAANSSEGDQA